MTNGEKAKEIAEEQQQRGFEKKDIYPCSFTAAMEMAEWKDKKIKEILLVYTKWLDKRGFFKEDLQCDFLHQIETFLEIDKE